MLEKLKTPGLWRASFAVGKKRVSRRIYAKDRAEAERKMRALRGELETAVPSGREAPLLADVEQLDIQRARRAGLAEGSIGSLLNEWHRIITGVGNVPADMVTATKIDSYITHRLKLGIARQTIARELRTLQRGLREGKRIGWLLSVPELPALRSDGTGAKSGKWHPPDIVERWLSILPPESSDFFRLCLLTGMRRTELERLRPSDIGPAPNESPVSAVARIRRSTAKMRRERVVGLLPEALDALKRNSRGDDDPIFGAVLTRQQSAIRKCQRLMKKTYPHVITARDMRHIHATVIAEHANIVDARDALGHTNVKTTNIYLHAHANRVVSAPVHLAAYCPSVAVGQSPRDPIELAHLRGGMAGQLRSLRASYGRPAPQRQVPS